MSSFRSLLKCALVGFGLSAMVGCNEKNETAPPPTVAPAPAASAAKPVKARGSSSVTYGSDASKDSTQNPGLR
jgi:hypothetical protein